MLSFIYSTLQANIVVFNLKFSHVLTNNLEENFSLLRTTTNNHQVLSSSSSSLFSPFIFTWKIKTNFLLFFGAFVLVHFCLALRNLVQYLIKYIDHVCFNFCRAYNTTRNINNIISQSVYFNCLLWFVGRKCREFIPVKPSWADPE